MVIDLKEHYKDYICRNKNGDLVIFKLSYWEPQRRGDIWIGNEWVNLGAYEVGEIVTEESILDQYKNLKWEDEPMKLN
jgi:hypothetical protein